MKIFGRSIGCGQCLPVVETPIGESCQRCGVAINVGDVGVVISHEAGTSEEPISIEKPWHIACLRAALGISNRGLA